MTQNRLIIIDQANKRVKRTLRDCNLGLKLALVSEVEKGNYTYKQTQKVYGIQGRSTIWYGYDCYQNALAACINGILKQELLIHKCNNLKELKQLIKESTNTYNNKRPHLSLSMKMPHFKYNKKPEKLTSLV